MKCVVLLTVHHGTLMNQHQLDTLLWVRLLRANASTCFGRYSPIFRRLCRVAIWCNWVRSQQVSSWCWFINLNQVLLYFSHTEFWTFLLLGKARRTIWSAHRNLFTFIIYRSNMKRAWEQQNCKLCYCRISRNVLTFASQNCWSLCWKSDWIKIIQGTFRLRENYLMMLL
jgi:hypothetical protein